MKKFVFGIFLILSFSILITYLSAIKNEKTEYESEINLVPEQCIQLLSSNRGGGGAWNLRFYNTCGESMYAIACVEETPGKFKLYKSGSRIPQLGYWNLYIYTGGQPLSLALSSGRGVPGNPGTCGIEKNK